MRNVSWRWRRWQVLRWWRWRSRVRPGGTLLWRRWRLLRDVRLGLAKPLHGHGWVAGHVCVRPAQPPHGHGYCHRRCVGREVNVIRALHHSILRLSHHLLCSHHLGCRWRHHLLCSHHLGYFRQCRCEEVRRRCLTLARQSRSLNLGRCLPELDCWIRSPRLA